MAKGRKLTITNNRSELYLGTINHNHNQETENNNDESDFEEDDVWSTIHDDPVNRNNHSEWPPRAAAHGSRKQTLSGQRQGKVAGGLSLAFDNSNSIHSSPSKVVRDQCVATSAPVNVPGWSKGNRVDPIGSFCELDDGLNDPEMVPPHEYLGQKMAASSVFEGVGRTLKGRDMSRVRDAVWNRTGFYG